MLIKCVMCAVSGCEFVSERSHVRFGCINSNKQGPSMVVAKKAMGWMGSSSKWHCGEGAHGRRLT